MANHLPFAQQKRSASIGQHKIRDLRNGLEKRVVAPRQLGGLVQGVTNGVGTVVGSTTGGCFLGVGDCNPPVENTPAPAPAVAQTTPAPVQTTRQTETPVNTPAAVTPQTTPAVVNTPAAPQPAAETTPAAVQTPAANPNPNTGSNSVAAGNGGITTTPADGGNAGSSGTTAAGNGNGGGNGVNAVSSPAANPNAIATTVVSSLVNGQIVVSTATVTGSAVLASASALSREASILAAGGTITTTNAQGQTLTLAGTSAAAAAASSLSSLISVAGIAGRITAPVATTTAFATQVQTATDSFGHTYTTTLIQPVPSPTNSHFSGNGSGAEQPASKAFIGIIVGVLAGVALLIALVVFGIRRRRRRAAAAIPTTHNSQFFTDRAPSPVFTSFPVTFASRDEPSLERLAASATGRHASFGSSFREQFMPAQRTSANFTATHPYGNYAAGGGGRPVAAHYSSAPLLDVPLTPPITAFNGWQSASMPTFGNLTRLPQSTGSGSLEQDSDTDSELAYNMEADSPMMVTDPFRRSVGESSEDVYLQARSRATSRQSGAISSLSVHYDDDAGDLGGHSPSDGFSIDSFETARAKRDSDYSEYSQSSSADDHTATYHVGVEGARATLMDRRGLDPFRDSIGSSSSTATAQPYTTNLTPTRSTLAPIRSDSAGNARAISALSYSSAGSSILNFKSDFPESPRRK